MSRLLRMATISIACLVYAGSLGADPLHRTVLVLDQSIPYTEYFRKLFASFRSTLKTGRDIPITIYSEQLE